MKLVIRPFKSTEYADWKTLFLGYMSDVDDWDRRLTRVNWQRIHDKSNSYTAFAAYDGDRPVGFIARNDRFSSLDIKRVCYISDAYVAPDYRRKGIARKLFKTVFKKLDKKRYGRIEWKTARSNRKARKLYDDIGVRTNWIIYEHSSRKT